MTLSFTVVFDTGLRKFEGLDGYYGSSSLLGVNQLLLISLSAFVNKQVITQAPAAKGFRLILRATRQGSFHQIIDVLSDPNVRGVIQDLGKDALYDLLKYGLRTGVGIMHQLTHRKAKIVLKELGSQDDDWQEKVEEPLLRIHQPIKHQGYKVRILAGRTELVELDENTLDFLETEIVEEDMISVKAAISRFNVRTGTGRLILEMEGISVPFAPHSPLSDVRKTLLADNLAEVARGHFEPLTVYVKRVTSQDGRLKSYVLYGAQPKDRPLTATR